MIIIETINDIKAAGASIVTIGQYLQPTINHLAVSEYISPEQFDKYKQRPEIMRMADISQEDIDARGLRGFKKYNRKITQKMRRAGSKDQGFNHTYLYSFIIQGQKTLNDNE